jgi:hypothetical protein
MMHRRSLLRYSLLPFLLWVGQPLPSFLLGVVFAKGQHHEVEYFSNLILLAVVSCEMLEAA